jgi:alpha-L-arabinofuranosidase
MQEAESSKEKETKAGRNNGYHDIITIKNSWQGRSFIMEFYIFGKFVGFDNRTQKFINPRKMKKLLLLSAALFITFQLSAQKSPQATLTVQVNEGNTTISKHIYGHFSEHLGRCIYGGIWVGEDSDIPNIQGYRKDVFEALKNLNIPNLRWPGGCFADEYHWKDGIGPKEDRPEMVNTHWGGVVEDNSFGTNEFLDFCNLLGTEPVICGNVGSGSVEEMADWVEYINFDGKSPMADLRRANGRDDSWGIKYWGVGNESWGCGGNMTPQFYADQYRRYATYARNYGDHKLYKIAGGANSWDLKWTETLMENIPLRMMDGISLHYYTVPYTWANKGSATQFDEKDYFITLQKAGAMDELVSKHSTIMDQYDPDKRIALVVDEWGTWYDVEPGTNPGFLYQQNSIRDALTAGMTLNIFNNHADRVKMANIAQTVNVLQAVILTNDQGLILTPTYHVFDMYQPHMDALSLPYYLQSPNYKFGDETQQAISVSCSKSADGTVNITLVNIDPKNDISIVCTPAGIKANEVSGKVITSPNITDHNTFEDPDKVTIKDFDNVKIQKGNIETVLPSKSVVLLRIK